MGRPQERLNEDDAMHTIAIHTNAGILGFGEAIAHVDFYPNGGKKQPGCGLDVSGSCAHSRSYEIFSEAFETDQFIAVKCESVSDAKNEKCEGERLVLRGDPANIDARGVFHFRTANSSPFAIGLA